jgi:hypothetical protein
MSLPTPSKLAKEVFFFVALIVVVLPLVHWTLIAVGVGLLAAHHWIVGPVLAAVGLAGLYVNKTIRI